MDTRSIKYTENETVNIVRTTGCVTGRALSTKKRFYSKEEKEVEEKKTFRSPKTMKQPLECPGLINPKALNLLAVKNTQYLGKSTNFLSTKNFLSLLLGPAPKNV